MNDLKKSWHGNHARRILKFDSRSFFKCLAQDASWNWFCFIFYFFVAYEIIHRLWNHSFPPFSISSWALILLLGSTFMNDSKVDLTSKFHSWKFYCIVNSFDVIFTADLPCNYIWHCLIILIRWKGIFRKC